MNEDVEDMSHHLISQNTSEPDAATAPAFLSVLDIHAYYGESYIVQGVSFNVHEGEILALLGRNGAGKTTTLRSISRLGQPAGQPW
jgi:branched-chain amino acid transport system ATP-binding protein